MAIERGFDRALKHVLVHEGRKVNHPKDPGGRTNKGVTQRIYNAWRAKSHLAPRDVYLIDDLEGADIYRFQYWNAVMGDALPEGLGYVVFDGAVNSGPKLSIKWLQRALGSLYAGAVDGVMGTLTLQAVAAVNDVDALIGRIIDRREAFLRALKTWADFGRGWQRRLDRVEQTGQAWATGSVGPQPTFVGGNEKAALEDAQQAPGKGGGWRGGWRPRRRRYRRGARADQGCARRRPMKVPVSKTLPERISENSEGAAVRSSENPQVRPEGLA